MKKSILEKINELQDIITEIKEMWYDVTYNLIASLYEQIDNPKCTCWPTNACSFCTKLTTNKIWNAES